MHPGSAPDPGSALDPRQMRYHLNPTPIRGMPAGGWCIRCAYAKLMRAKPAFAKRKQEKTFIPHLRRFTYINLGSIMIICGCLC